MVVRFFVWFFALLMWGFVGVRYFFPGFFSIHGCPVSLRGCPTFLVSGLLRDANTTVDVQLGSGDEIGFIGSQEQCSMGNILRFTDATQRRFFSHFASI